MMKQQTADKIIEQANGVMYEAHGTRVIAMASLRIIINSLVSECQECGREAQNLLCNICWVLKRQSVSEPEYHASICTCYQCKSTSESEEE